MASRRRGPDSEASTTPDFEIQQQQQQQQEQQQQQQEQQQKQQADSSARFESGLGQTLLSHGDGVLALASMAAMQARPTCLWLVTAGWAAFVLAGRRSADLEVREDGKGTLFAVVLGPLLVAAYDDVNLWPQVICPELVALGSLQVLFDLAASDGRGWSLSAASASWFMLVTIALAMGLPLVTSAVFLVAQRLACRWCFSKSCWGRCFSVPEGTFWSQCAGCLCAVISQGLAAGFEGWSPLGVFSSCLAAFGLVFMSLTAVTNTLLSGAGGWSPLVAAVVTLAMFLAWGVTGAGGWFAVSAEVPLSWFVRYIGQPQHLWLLLLQWPLLLVVGIGLTDQLARVAVKASAVRGQQFGNRMRVLIRKAFHVLAVAMFAPPILMNRSAFLGLSFLVACLLFIALEACRVCRTPMVGNTMDSFVVRYLDTKEDIGRGDLVLTHLYLLVGCAIPVWLEKEPAAQQGVEGVLASLLGLSGILLIGVGDAFAAAFGVSFGTHRWPGSHRTLEGSLAFVVSIVVAAAALIAVRFGQEGLVQCQALVPGFLLATGLSMLLEVYTSSIDNLVLPLYFCPTLKILQQSLAAQL